MPNITIVGRCLLNQILHKKKMSSCELACKVGMLPSQISDYLNNHRAMSLKNARKISKALGCHIDDLYDWSTFEE